MSSFLERHIVKNILKAYEITYEFKYDDGVRAGKITLYARDERDLQNEFHRWQDTWSKKQPRATTSYKIIDDREVPESTLRRRRRKRIESDER